MKKSKIIIPALGMLLLSTAASISGTVAWFTTVSSADANITSFAVRKLGGDLDYTVTAGTGTEKVTSSDPKSAITLTGTNPAMCDSSFNHAEVMDYKANSNATQFTALETAENSGISDETKWAVNGTDANSQAMVTYYAVSWTYTFTYNFGGDSTAVNLYFDGQSSAVEKAQVITAASGSQTEQTWKGFRIAFLASYGANSASSAKVVWANQQTAANCHYIQSSTTYDADTGYANLGSYSSNLIDSTGLTRVSENASGSTSRADFLGQFTSTANTITVKCVAWFEGTDPNVINGSEMDKVNAALGFYTRPNAA